MVVAGVQGDAIAGGQSGRGLLGGVGQSLEEHGSDQRSAHRTACLIPMFELKDSVYGGTAYCSLNEGLGKVLRYGAYDPEVITHLHWISQVLGPPLQQAVRARGPLDVKAIITRCCRWAMRGTNATGPGR